ncbi:MAG TPA: hypothetical protein VNM72_02595 [Blastocatellia bacterium]|nr:hypothetical protein [Blastocatellia bacterium]
MPEVVSIRDSIVQQALPLAASPTIDRLTGEPEQLLQRLGQGQWFPIAREFKPSLTGALASLKPIVVPEALPHGQQPAKDPLVDLQEERNPTVQHSARLQER